MQGEAERKFCPREDREAVWPTVERWPGLRTEHRQALWALYGQCPPGKRTLVTSYAELMQLMGVAQSSVHRRLSGLDRQGLVRFEARDLKITIRFHDPRRIRKPERPLRVKLRGRGSGGQRTLWEGPPLRVFTLPEPPLTPSPAADPSPVRDAAHPEPVPDVIPDRTGKAEPVPVVGAQAESIPDISGAKTPAPPITDKKDTYLHCPITVFTDITASQRESGPSGDFLGLSAQETQQQKAWVSAQLIADLRQRRRELARLLSQIVGMAGCRDPRYLFGRAAVAIVDEQVPYPEVMHAAEDATGNRCKFPPAAFRHNMREVLKRHGLNFDRWPDGLNCRRFPDVRPFRNGKFRQRE